MPDRRKEEQSAGTAFKRWFRCRECGHRFFARDGFLVRAAALSGFSVIAVGAALTWSYTLSPASSLPIQEEAIRAVGDSDRAGSAAIGVADALENGSVRNNEEQDVEAKYQAGVRIIHDAWRNGEQFKLVDGVELVRAAAETGHHQAQVLLGRCYENGRGVIKNYPQALSWYRLSAAAGNPTAMERIGGMLADGRGVETDLVAAYQWLNLAAARGSTDAQRELGRIEAIMSDAELTLAQEESLRLDATLPRITAGSVELPKGF